MGEPDSILVFCHEFAHIENKLFPYVRVTARDLSSRRFALNFPNYLKIYLVVIAVASGLDNTSVSSFSFS